MLGLRVRLWLEVIMLWARGDVNVMERDRGKIRIRGKFRD